VENYIKPAVSAYQRLILITEWNNSIDEIVNSLREADGVLPVSSGNGQQ
jgi:hypothetical protein